ncbi:hypothetical protein HZH66_009098 [Vespula vulgaris]|uniref:Uncharacterized protein n=1 Tax=Vespula vulgaris TaxID=7454 RepID=A0A834JSF6_VESVU|nr:hypothetical protein HZH66_009098 [Vespula vulgaris]
MEKDRCNGTLEDVGSPWDSRACCGSCLRDSPNPRETELKSAFRNCAPETMSQRERNANTLLLNVQTLSKTRRRSETANKGKQAFDETILGDRLRGNGCQRRTEQPLLNSNVAGGRLRSPDQSREPISQSLGVELPSRV